MIISNYVHAASVLGGNLELISRSSTTNGKFRLLLHVYYDKSGGAPTSSDDNLKVGIFQKSNNTLKASLTLKASSLTGKEVSFNNQDCANSQQLGILQVDYEGDFVVSSADYADAGGYYVVVEKCCRANVTNISSPTSTGALFYLEFPALKQSGNEFYNSSPEFHAITGAYICKGQAFSYDFGANDRDNDQLSYALVTPYKGSSTSSNSNPTPTGSGSYATVSWAGGSSASAQIPGSPALSVNASGILSVTASTVGTYLFCVEVTEKRNGVTIGKTRRDFVLKVIDCSATVSATPVISDASGSPISTGTVCKNGYIDLSTTASSNYTYQWQKDGLNIAGATDSKVKAEGAGTYTVLVSAKNGCGLPKASSNVTLTERQGLDLELTSSYRQLCKYTLIQVKEKGTSGQYNTNDFVYTWSANNSPISTQNYAIQYDTPLKSTTVEFKVSLQPVASAANACTYMLSLKIDFPTFPDATLKTSSGQTTYCDSDDFSIGTTLDLSADYNYVWTKNGSALPNETSNIVKVKDTGQNTYGLTVTTSVGCTDTKQITVTGTASTPVTFKLDPICLPTTATIDLTKFVNPYNSGGVFKDSRGTTLTSTTINPTTYGAGSYDITYTFGANAGCQSKATANLKIGAAPVFTLSPDVVIQAGESTTLTSSLATSTNLADYTLLWSPATGLSEVNTPVTVATPNQSTNYALKVTDNATQCADEKIVKVFVSGKVVNTFTPNEDGINDFWDLSDITTSFPNASVKLFNRWGNEVFNTNDYASNPFKGIIDDKEVKSSTYYYVIEIRKDWPTLTGYLTVIK